MEIKEEVVERPEPYPDGEDPLSWNVEQVNKTYLGYVEKMVAISIKINKITRERDRYIYFINTPLLLLF